MLCAALVILMLQLRLKIYEKMCILLYNCILIIYQPKDLFNTKFFKITMPTEIISINIKRIVGY